MDQSIPPISESGDLSEILHGENAVMCYFSNESCQVCKVLKPKIGNFLLTQYPKIRPLYIDISQHTELAAAHSIFAVPTVLVFFEGKEFYRISRNIGIEELKRMIDRPYSLLFS